MSGPPTAATVLSPPLQLLSHQFSLLLSQTPSAISFFSLNIPSLLFRNEHTSNSPNSSTFATLTETNDASTCQSSVGNALDFFGADNNARTVTAIAKTTSSDLWHVPPPPERTIRTARSYCSSLHVDIAMSHSCESRNRTNCSAASGHRGIASTTPAARSYSTSSFSKRNRTPWLTAQAIISASKVVNCDTQRASPIGPFFNFCRNVVRVPSHGMKPIFFTRRPFSINALRMTSGRRLKTLESEANADPSDARRQAVYYKELLRSGNPSALISRVERGTYATDQECLQLYAVALARMNQAERIVPRLLERIRQGHPVPMELPLNTVNAEQSNIMNSETFRSPVAGHGKNHGVFTLPSHMGNKSAPIYVVLDESRQFKWGAAKWIAMTTIWGFFLFTFVSLGLENTGLLRATPTQSEFEPSTDKIVKFTDVKGVDEAKEELEEIVEFLKDPAKFNTCGGKLPKGVLLTGPPGTGKTLLARAVAGEAGVPFFFMSGSEFDEMYVGVGAKRVRELFAAARRKAPSIVFIDELDAVGGKRSVKDQTYMRQTLNQLLVDLDGFSQTEGVIFIGATNFPELLDKALLRPGRFDRHVTVPLPDVRGRMEILRHHMDGIQVDYGVDISKIARGTPGFSGADLANLVNIAAIQSSRDGLSVVGMKQLEYAKDRILMGAELRSKFITEESKKLTAYHEGGHAIVAYYSPGAMPLHKATIMPRGKSLGMIVQLPEMDKENFTRKEFLAQLDVAMGGRVAEEMIFGKENVTSGAMSDFANATGVARRMVTVYGMSDKVGPVYHENDDIISAGMKATIEGEIKSLVEAARDRACDVLKMHVQELHRLAAALVEYETLSQEDIEAVIKGKTIVR